MSLQGSAGTHVFTLQVMTIDIVYFRTFGMKGKGLLTKDDILEPRNLRLAGGQVSKKDVQSLQNGYR